MSKMAFNTAAAITRLANIEHFVEAKSPTSSKDIAQAFGISTALAHVYAAKLANDGRINRTERSRCESTIWFIGDDAPPDAPFDVADMPVRCIRTNWEHDAPPCWEVLGRFFGMPVEGVRS